jgi:hypothetical protein
MIVPDLARASARGVCGLTIGLTVLSLLGCGGSAFSAGGTDGGTSGLDGGTLSEGGTGNDAGGPGGQGDGGTADAGPSYCALSGAQFDFCSDFDTGALIPPWERQVTAGTGASSKVDATASRSAPASLLMTTAPNTAPSAGTYPQDNLLKTGIKKQNAQLQFDLDIERVSFGGSDAVSSVVVATVAQGTDYSLSLILRPSTSGGTTDGFSLALLEVSGTSTPNLRALKPVPALGAWSHVTLDLNFNALQAAVTVQVDANAQEKMSLSPSPGALAATSVRSLAVGVTVTGPVADYAARIDNVTYK